MSYGDTRILKYWEPKHLAKDYLRIAFQQEVEALIGTFSAEFWTVRDPSYSHPETNLRWHHDDPNRELWTVAWANVFPTEFQGFTAGDGDILLVRNLEFKHRTPPNICQSDNRWYVQFHDVRPSSRTKLGKRFI